MCVFVACISAWAQHRKCLLNSRMTRKSMSGQSASLLISCTHLIVFWAFVT